MKKITWMLIALASLALAWVIVSNVQFAYETFDECVSLKDRWEATGLATIAFVVMVVVSLGWIVINVTGDEDE